MIFVNFFYVYENTILEKDFCSDMESRYKNIFKIRNVTFIFRNFEKILKT